MIIIRERFILSSHFNRVVLTILIGSARPVVRFGAAGIPSSGVGPRATDRSTSGTIRRHAAKCAAQNVNSIIRCRPPSV